MFVIQRILEAEGRMTLLDQSRIINPNKYFRLFATANTIGLGDTSGSVPWNSANQSRTIRSMEHSYFFT